MLSSKVVTSSRTNTEDVLTRILELTKTESSETKGLCVGSLTYVNEKGEAFVDYPGNMLGPIPARSLVPQLRRDNLPILLIFENGNPQLPIIIGPIYNTVGQGRSSQAVSLQVSEPKDIFIDGKKLVLNAQEEIMLCCGDGSIVIKKGGKIILKGTEIVSRASRTNKIKGASVAIN